MRARSGPRSTSRARGRRRLGIGLLAFGVAGLFLVLATAAVVLASLGTVNDAASGFERQRAELVAMIDPASAALSDAAGGAEHVGGSLTQASDASRRAADLTDRLASSFESMAGLGSLEIFGTRPFAAAASQFSDVAIQSRALSADLRSTADALTTNLADSQAIAADLRTLATRLDQIEASMGSGAASGGSSTNTPIGLAMLLLIGLLAWFSIPAIASIWLGGRLLRAARRDHPVPSDGVI